MHDSLYIHELTDGEQICGPLGLGMAGRGDDIYGSAGGPCGGVGRSDSAYLKLFT